VKFVIDLLFGMLFGLSLAGLGLAFFKKLLKTDIDFPTGFFAGVALLIPVLFAAGLAGLFNRTFFIVLTIVIGVFVIVGRRELSRGRLKIRLNTWFLLPLVLAIATLCILGLSSLSPPIKNDTLYYHLGLPKLWLADGRANFYPTIVYSATGLSSELVLTQIVSVASAESAQFFMFLTGVMVMLLFVASCKRLLGGSGAAAFVALAAVPIFLSGLADAKNDYLATGFALIAAIFYVDFVSRGQRKFLIFAGVFAGLAVSTKANALIFLLAMLITVSVTGRHIKDLLWFLLPAAVFGAPWYVKAFVDTGNPFYPFFSGAFGSPHWHPMFDSFNQATSFEREARSLLGFMTAPFRLIYLPDIFRGRLGPVPLVFLPLAALFRPVPSFLKKLLIISASFYVLWYIVWPGARYMMPVIPLLSFGAAFVIERLIKTSKSIAVLVVVCLSLLLGMSVLQAFRDGRQRMAVTLGVVDRGEFLRTAVALDPNALSSAEMERALPYYDVWRFLNEYSRPDAVVGILNSNWYRADGFYLDRRYFYMNPTEQREIDFTSVEALDRTLEEKSPDYILIDQMVVAEFSGESSERQAPGFEVFSRSVHRLLETVQQNGRLVFSTGRFDLYQMQ